MRVTKMHGLGNDYIYVIPEREMDWPDISRRVSERHFGIGSDGLILALPSDVADMKMRMFNADGSEAEMCGNGIRCVAKFAVEEGLVANGKDVVTVETLAGIKTLELFREGGVITGARVDMGPPSFDPAALPANVEKGQSLYQKWLLDLVQKHGVSDSSVTAVAKLNARGVYQQLSFAVANEISAAVANISDVELRPIEHDRRDCGTHTVLGSIAQPLVIDLTIRLLDSSDKASAYIRVRVLIIKQRGVLYRHATGNLSCVIAPHPIGNNVQQTLPRQNFWRIIWVLISEAIFVVGARDAGIRTALYRKLNG